MQRSRYLSDGWFRLNLEAASGWPERPGVSCTANFEVTGAPEGKVRYHAVIRDGRLVEMAGGHRADAAVSMVYRYEDALAEVVGGDHPDLAFMTGRMKLEGDYPRWVYGLRALLNSPEHLTYRSLLAEYTDF
ncbi:SCP2 sterol-binding domain-containing protein [Candidatus Poriferisocius sp.]|uniref:SCP2 sterol-binding domain-containing protein n=1 Tax=Candidatus Poriferisocius sp. TaxID=3101276 RepID=UPI003B02DE4B